ncbi:FusB/FusC family EF-G-binding protein [Neobacillus sp. MER 74]|uniref:FusB/FusC family EF-G-binding protein n=1 Tax=Neobacillus sp. MER 74 TaxID=2939566 RepID=UPI0020406ED3|nr:FusB/FusC family EF-G-binding protein [Neobacillus sp. MER 74]MCM3116508.1 FusB/FusC family EF-G-binding protein [Neobacillus sp. MER 74]
MTEKFIKNADFNFIQNQVALIKDSYKKNVAPNVIQAVKDLANAKIIELYPNATNEQQKMLDLSAYKTDQEYDKYMRRLQDSRLPLPKIPEAQLKKMFPKNKKLKLPDLDKMNLDQMSYLSWVDISTNKKFIVFELEEKMVGIECKYTILPKDNICSFCNRFGQVAYISTVTKAKKAKNPDYYKAIGNYMCFDSEECNKKITNVDYLTIFLKESLGEKTVL